MRRTARHTGVAFYQMASWLSRISISPITRIQGTSFTRQIHAFTGYRSRSRIKVCLIGADSAVGAPLAMLLQRSKLIDDVALYGRSRPERLAAELCCVPTRPVIAAYGSQDDGLCCALEGAQVVLLAEGAFRSGAVKREDHFRTHAKSACDYGWAIGEKAPDALVGVITSPISAMLPVVWECVRRAGGRQPERRVMGVTSLPAARAVAQAARVLKADPATLKVHVAGGTCGGAAVPLLSALAPQQKLTQLESSAIIASVGASGSRIRRALQSGFGSIVACQGDKADPEDCGDCAFGGHSSIGMFMPAFSIAHAANKFVDAAVRAVSGHRCVEINAFIVSHVANFSAEFAATPVMLGRTGVLKRLPLPTPSEWEASLLDSAKESLRQDMVLARDFLTEKFGKSKRPTGMSDDCPGYNFGPGANIFRVCGEEFYPESPPFKPGGCGGGCGRGADYGGGYFGEEDPCEEIYTRGKGK